MFPVPARFFGILLLALLAAMGPAIVAWAQPADTESGNAAPKRTNYRFSYTPIYQLETDLDGGGRFDVQRHFLRLDATRMIDRWWMIGLGLSFDYERWNFSGLDGLDGIDPWDEIVRPGINLPIIYSTANRWRLMVVPSLEFAGATGAETDESLSYGAVLSAAHAFGPNRMIGFGAGAFDRLDEWEVFPFLVVEWKLSDRLKIGNPFRAGPVGPAGLELTYTPTENWDLGIGGAYRNYRFRLDDSSAVADGIGEVSFWATFLRLGWGLGQHYRLDLNGGALFGGKIAIDDEDGNELGETEYDPAPFVGVTIKVQF